MCRFLGFLDLFFHNNLNFQTLNECLYTLKVYSTLALSPKNSISCLETQSKILQKTNKNLSETLFFYLKNLIKSAKKLNHCLKNTDIQPTKNLGCYPLNQFCPTDFEALECFYSYIILNYPRKIQNESIQRI